MRKLTALFGAGLLSLSLAGSASALSLSPDPVLFSTPGGSSGSIDALSVTATKLTLQASVDSGRLKKLFVLVTDATQSTLRDPTGVGKQGGENDFGIKKAKIRDEDDVLEAKFVFKRGSQPAPPTRNSQVFFIDFASDNLQINDLVFLRIKMKDERKVTVMSTIVPEPATALLFGLGLAGLAVMGSRRTQSAPWSYPACVDSSPLSSPGPSWSPGAGAKPPRSPSA